MLEISLYINFGSMLQPPFVKYNHDVKNMLDQKVLTSNSTKEIEPIGGHSN